MTQLFVIIYLVLSNLLAGPLLVDATVYQLTTAQCDGDPNQGAYGPMGVHSRECALTLDLQRKLGLKPGQTVLVWTPGNAGLSGAWVFWDRMPGSGLRIDLCVDGTWSGEAVVVGMRARGGEQALPAAPIEEEKV